ncbi:MAG: hypothetical protein GC184_06570 [Rhizobiales bacterium]|nr:hypothetical protein [Hyphomicrobiales bacterium]
MQTLHTMERRGKVAKLGPVGLALLILMTLSACADQKAESNAVPAAPVSNTPVAAAPSPAELASAGIPIPLPSPKHMEGIQVASIDPRAGVGAVAALEGQTSPYVDFNLALAKAEQNKMRSPKDIREILKQLAIFAPEDLADGWLEKQGHIAAQNAVFAKNVRQAARDQGKDQLLAVMESDDNFAFSIRGAGAATADVIAAVAIDNKRMGDLSARLIQTAYKFQKQKWGMSTPLTSLTKTAAIDETPGLSLSDFSFISTANAYSTTVMRRILVLGAREVLDAQETADEKDGTGTARCLNWARLNLSQCLAAARFPSEEAYCAGTHAVAEVQSCFASALPASAVTSAP